MNKYASLRTAPRFFLLGAAALALTLSHSAIAQSFNFTAGDVVVSVEGDGSNTGTYTDNQAAPFTLLQFATTGTSSATAAGSLLLPQTASGSNAAFSGEYGSSSEGTLQLSGNGQYLTVMGYGVNAASFNANPGAYGGVANNTALAQSSSSLVPRVVALISANGSVNTSTALTNVFNQNNPRSAYTVDGSTFYVSGQGLKGDATGGTFYAPLGATTATSITGTDGGSGSSQDTREVQIYNNTLYVSVDSKAGSTNRSMIGTLGTVGTLPTGVANGNAGPTALPGISGSVALIAGQGNTINGSTGTVNLSPENFFFANASTLYVADSGSPKIGTSAGDGGLQKWTLGSGGTWTLDYTLSKGLNLVSNTGTSGTTGLYGLTGEVVNGVTELFATNYTIGDLDPTFLYGISDPLANASSTTAGSESFTLLSSAASGENFKGVAFAPTGVSAAPLPPSAILILSGVAVLVGLGKRRRSPAAMFA